MSSNNIEYMVICDNLVKIYKAADIEVVALQGLDLTVEKGELMAIIGNSGSGKSTLLNILGGLDRPSAGKVFVNGQDLLKLTDKQLVKYKRETVGFVWQNNARNLIPYLTALENVELPMFFTGSAKRQRALELLDMVGLSHRKNNKLEQLSGGEQQRVAIAIALANNPSLLLADEPTGAVDTRTASHILDVFREINEALGVTIIIFTHDRQIASKVDRVVAIRDGRTSSEFVRKKSYAEELAEISNDIGTVGGDTHVELAVIDRAGRLQIPREYVEALGLGEQNRVLVEMDGDRIVLRSPDTTLQSEQRTAGSDAV